MGGHGVADTASVFIEGDISAVVQAILDAPMSADEFCEPVLIGLLVQETGDAVCDFIASGTV